MNERKIYLPKLSDCKEYTLFLDRDGVINQPIINDYAKRPEDFIFCDGALEALDVLQQNFQRVIIVTNQQGIHRKIMSEKDLEDVHLKMYNSLKSKGYDYFNAVFFAPYLRTVKNEWRKPGKGMYIKALSYYPDMDWNKAIMVGDSPTDMGLADQYEVLKVKISNLQFSFDNQDFEFESLKSFVEALSN